MITTKFVRTQNLLRRVLGLPPIMWDSVNPLAIPVGAAMVAGYDTQLFAWPSTGWQRFPGVRHVHIVTQAEFNEGDVLDVENGDATPAQCEGWITGRKNAGYYRPTIYCSRSIIPAVRVGTGKWKLGTDYEIWVADWTGKPHQVDGCVATQFVSAPKGLNVDLSSVYAKTWPHRRAPEVKHPGFRHVASGRHSLDDVAAFRHTTANHIIAATRAYGSGISKRNLRKFNTFVRINGTACNMPKGLKYYTTNK